MDRSPWSTIKSEIYALLGRNPKSNRTIASIAGIEPGEVILDIGCGPGAAVRAASRVAARATGVDRSRPMVEIARRRSRRLPNVSFEVGAAESLPFPDTSFDRAWTIHSFHHWEDPDRGLAEARRVLRPEGRFLVIESETGGAHGLDRRRADELAKRMMRAGFDHTNVSVERRRVVVSGTVPSV